MNPVEENISPSSRLKSTFFTERKNKKKELWKYSCGSVISCSKLVPTLSLNFTWTDIDIDVTMGRQKFMNLLSNDQQIEERAVLSQVLGKF